MSRAPKPETLHQAAGWDRVCRLAIGAGLCHACAAQLAWGASLGFANVKPPCAACAEVIRHWPLERLRGWRTGIGALSRSSTWDALTSGSTPRTEPRTLRRASTVDEQLRERDG
ncbi:hypothetical protein QE411_002040 [Microbacterium arborescens]|nr:hypothetical protein [Microbacterium arborescens]